MSASPGRGPRQPTRGAALTIVLAFVFLFAGLALAYFAVTATDRQLAQSSSNDTSADLLARSALDIVVGDFKQEILTSPTITTSNIQPSPYPVPTPSDIPNLIRYSSTNAPASHASAIASSSLSANGRSISTTRWNSHYLVPKGNAATTDSSPLPSFTAPDWVLVTAQGPNSAPPPSTVIGRYAFAVYDEGGLLDMTLAGYPSWSGQPSATCSPAPTPWMVNVGRKGIVSFADLTALGTYAPPQTQIDKIIAWRNYATTLQSLTGFPSTAPSFTTDCVQQATYGDYLLDVGDPPFIINSLSDKFLASTYPFTSILPGVSSGRTDQAITSRQELLKLQRSLGFSTNILQYMGTFSRERNRPAADWPGLGASLSEGRFNLNNLALVVPNPADCVVAHGKKVGWQTGKNRNHLCGNSPDLMSLFGLFWVKAEVIDGSGKTPGHWKYIGHNGPLPAAGANPNAINISCLSGPNLQNDFFQVLDYALFRAACGPGGDTDSTRLAKTFAIGASLIDQYDSGVSCTGHPASWDVGCDLDSHVIPNNNDRTYATHTTVIEYGHGSGSSSTAYGMEPQNSADGTNGDCDPGVNSGGCNNQPHRPTPAPAPGGNTQVISHAFATVGEFGYGIDTSNPGLPTLDFSSPNFSDAPILDFFSYNPISSAYPRAGIVNLYTRNAPVVAAMLSQTLTKDPGFTPSPSPTPVVSATLAGAAAAKIVAETQNILLGAPAFGPVTQTDLTRAIAARLVAAGATATGWSSFTTEQRQSIARALAEMGQTRTWNLLIDVIAQTGKYTPNATDLTGGNFVVQGEKRYWLHIALGRDLVQPDGTPCAPGVSTGCQVDVLGSQLEEVIE